MAHVKGVWRTLQLASRSFVLLRTLGSKAHDGGIMELDCQELVGWEAFHTPLDGVQAVQDKRKMESVDSGASGRKALRATKKPAASASSLSPSPAAAEEELGSLGVEGEQSLSHQSGKSGPATVDEALMWTLDAVNMVKEAGLLPTILEKLQGGGIDVSTDYSGCGQAETACGFILSALQQLGCETGEGIRCTRSGDVSENRRSFLLSHSGMAHGCVFGDIVSRMRIDHRNLLQKLLQRHHVGGVERTDCIAEGAVEGCDAEDETDLCDADAPQAQSGDGFQAEIPEKPSLVNGIIQLVKQARDDWLQDVEVLECTKAFCHRCRKSCPIFPRSQTQMSGGDNDKDDDADGASHPPHRRLTLHISGVSCIDWSSRGKQSKWAGLDH